MTNKYCFTKLLHRKQFTSNIAANTSLNLKNSGTIIVPLFIEAFGHSMKQMLIQLSVGITAKFTLKI
jgi:hypothetical protein